jgi:hypothetical protein
MTNETLAALTAVRNEAAALLDEKPVKKLSTKKDAIKIVDDFLGRLKPNQHELREPNGEVGKVRPSSAMVPVIEVLSQDAGATIEEVANVLVRFYKGKEQELARPKVKARGLINTLKTKGLGFRRVGDRYWLVSP